MDTRYIFVTGGVTSSLGKGITAASLGRLLKARGYTVAIQKFDPYLNIDPGTMNPYQHGEPTSTWATTSALSMKTSPAIPPSPPGRCFSAS